MDLDWGNQSTFLILTLIVIVVIICVTKKLSDALVIIGLISQFLIISSLMPAIHERHVKDSESDLSYDGVPLATMYAPSYTQQKFKDRDVSEHFASVPVDASFPSAGLEPEDIEAMRFTVPVGGTELTPGAGVYLPADQGNDGPILGGEFNPYQHNRIESRAEPHACNGDVSAEAYAGAPLFDADRMIVEQARWRHDPYRVANGTRRRKALIERFAEEEVAAEENSPWWGRYDF